MAIVDLDQANDTSSDIAVHHGDGLTRRQYLATGTTMAAGVGLVIWAYHLASAGQTSFTHYHLFWLGMFLIFSPLALLLLRPGLSRRTGVLVLAAAGLASYLPRFIRAPNRPYMNDELGHWLQAERMFRTSRLYTPNAIVHQAAHYVGLETMTVGLRELTGLSTWRLATILIAVFHVLSMLGIFQLVRQAVGRDKPAMLAAFAYALSPAISFFDSMYAYESFAVPLMIWCLAAMVSAANAEGGRRRSWIGLAILTGVCCVITHHLISFILIIGLVMLTTSHFLVRKSSSQARRDWRATGAMALGLTALAFGWAANRHAGIISYLDVYPREGLRALANLVTGTHAQAPAAGGPVANVAGTRSVFSNAHIPAYERLTSYIVQPLLLAGFCLGLWRRRRALAGNFGLLVGFGLMYFVSLPLLLTGAGQAGAHRTWAASYVGLVAVIAVGVEPLLDWQRKHFGWRRAGMVAATCLLLVANYGSANNWLEVFPGPFVYMGDGRVMSNELVHLTQWFSTHEGRDEVVMSDRLTSVAFASYAESEMAPITLDWQTFFAVSAIPRKTEAGDRTEVNFIVVDKRMATEAPLGGSYFDPNDEPGTVEPLPQQALTKFAHIPWLQEVHHTTHYVIYKVIP